MKRKGHIIAILLIALTMGLPALSLLLPAGLIRPLHGDVRGTRWPTDLSLTLDHWLDGSAQQHTGDMLEGRTGIRPVLVRLHHEAVYRLFGKTCARNVVVGRDGYLFETDYIHETTGRYYLGETVWRDAATRFSEASAWLGDSLGITVMVIVPPGKARMMHGHWSSGFRERGRTNYAEMLTQFGAKGIQLLDLHPVLESWSDTSRFPLFTKGGGHWSEYASSLAIDSILDWMAAVARLDPPLITADSIRIDTRPRGLDNDLGLVMNTFSSHQEEEMCYIYPRVIFSREWDAREWLFIGDSFMEQMVFANYFMRMQGGDPELWLYNKAVLRQRSYTEEVTGPDALQTRIESGLRYVVICLSERFMHTLGWGILDDLDELRDPGLPVDYTGRVTRDILSGREWFAYVVNRACCTGIPLDEAIRMEAEDWLAGESDWADPRGRRRYLPSDYP